MPLMTSYLYIWFISMVRKEPNEHLHPMSISEDRFELGINVMWGPMSSSGPYHPDDPDQQDRANEAGN